MSNAVFQLELEQRPLREETPPKPKQDDLVQNPALGAEKVTQPVHCEPHSSIRRAPQRVVRFLVPGTLDTMSVPIPMRRGSGSQNASPVGSPADDSFPQGFAIPQRQRINILLLEGVAQAAVQKLKNQEFNVETLAGSLSPEELKSKLSTVHALGIRSNTHVTADILAAAPNLLCIGCFCIGTDKVDLKAAEERGIPVFNSPYQNSRSVAELIIGMIINLARRLGDKNNEMHSGVWKKSAANCFEIRGKTLGIVGYGHIGSQLSVLAESMGMHVIFYDTVSAMPLGNSTPMPDLKSLLRKADFVSLHVPDTPQTRNMIGQDELAQMKKGAYLLNASRGTVVNIPDLVKALQAGHLGGAYVDVFPKEPNTATNDWHEYDDLAKCSNVLLTPHIGGSTTEAQVAIGDEVAERFIKFINQGCTLGSVNFPNLDLPYSGDGSHRILNVHHNRPGVLREINNIISIYNVEGQVLRTYSNIGYLVIDVDKEASDEIRSKIDQLPASIKTRVLY